MVRPTPRGNRGQVHAAAIETEFAASDDFVAAAKAPVSINTSATLPAERDWDLALAQAKPEIAPETLDRLLFVAQNPVLAEMTGETRRLIADGVYVPVGSTIMPDEDKIVVMDADFSYRFDRGAKHEKSRKLDGERVDIINRAKLVERAHGLQ